MFVCIDPLAWRAWVCACVSLTIFLESSQEALAGGRIFVYLQAMESFSEPDGENRAARFGGLEKLHPLQIAAWKQMTFTEKWDLVKAGQKLVRDAARRRIARQKPDLTPGEVEKEVAQFFIRART